MRDEQSRYRRRDVPRIGGRAVGLAGLTARMARPPGTLDSGADERIQVDALARVEQTNPRMSRAPARCVTYSCPVCRELVPARSTLLVGGPMEDTDYALGRTGTEYDRLIEQAELLRPLTERMLRAAGISTGMHVLDIGCGVGDVSFLVSSLVGAPGSVVGVDLDRDAIQIAEKRRAAQRLTNVTFRQGDARSIEFEQLFDAAVGRLVLMFTRDPTAALRRIAEQVRPGGVVAFHEWVGRVPSAMNQPVLASVQQLLSRTFERSGAQLDIGAELYRRMLDAGLEPDPRPLAEIAVDGAQGAVAHRRWALIAQSLLPKIVEYGLATGEDVHRTVRQELREELRAGHGLTPLSWLMIGQWARKPAP